MKTKPYFILNTLALLVISLIGASLVHAMPSFQDVKNRYKKSDALLLDRHGEVIHELRVDKKGRRLEWVALRDISPSLVKAVVHSEDRRFYEHHGVDWRAVGSSILTNIFSRRSRGASTITMQLASMLDRKLRPGRSKRTLLQKWDQMDEAREIDDTWSKDMILEAYLNLLTFRGELQGISAASSGLFGKRPDGLDEGESLLLASLIRSPNAGVRDVASRACALSASMKSHASCEAVGKLAAERLWPPYALKPRISLAPQAARLLLGQGSEKVVSTLDGKLQRFAGEVLQYQLAGLKDRNVLDGAMLVVDNKTGDILSYVANSGLSASAGYVDGIRAKRQAGSTLKPFLYGLAIEKKVLTAASLLDDSPLNIATPVGLYVPRDYDNDFKGPVSLRTALSSSLNVPAVRTLLLLGPDAFASRLGQLGFEGLEDGEYYGLSLALGSVEVSLYELVNAYRTLANSGRWSGLKLLPGKKTAGQKQVMRQESAFIISDILSDREARSLTFGFENPLSSRFWTAVKTGTSKDMKDNWCIGYSQKYTVGVWVGNFSGEPMWNVSGVTGAAPAWLEIMNYLHKGNPGRSPKRPAGITARKMKFPGNIEAERNELFIPGTEPAPTAGNISPGLSAARDLARIIYPADGTIIALDPDIPDDRQMLFFQASSSGPDHKWLLNNRPLEVSHEAFAWKPRKGKYVLSLADSRGRIMDTVSFEVRGESL